MIAVWGAVLLPYLRTAREWMAGKRVLGAGKVRRRARCPDLGRRARLEVLYSEPAWGRLKASDVTWCSLFGPAPVTCEKKCLLRL